MLCSNKQPGHKAREASSHKEMPQQSERVGGWQYRTTVGNDAEQTQSQRIPNTLHPNSPWVLRFLVMGTW